MLAKLLLAFAVGVSASSMPALRLRGGMAVGPIDSDLAMGALKTAAALSVGSAIVEKYADMGETAISKFCKGNGEVFTTNAVINLCILCGSCLSPGFDSVKLTAALWLATVVLKQLDGGINVEDLVKKDLGTTLVAGVLALNAFVN